MENDALTIEEETRLHFGKENEEKWSEAGAVSISPIYGKHAIATRRIEIGEVIIEEIPILTTPYGDIGQKPLCLSCLKELSEWEVCAKCEWPLCFSTSCKNDSAHSDRECSIFVSANQKPPPFFTISVYRAIEVLRCLLLKQKIPAKYDRILKFKSHSESRKLSPCKIENEFIADFIRRGAKLTQYEPELIETLAGIFSINNFCDFRQGIPYVSMLFEKVTILVHDCDPNTRREILEIVKGVLCIRITATKTIENGEPISIFYADADWCANDVVKRREVLSSTFFFDCMCKRCVRELKELGEIPTSG